MQQDLTEQLTSGYLSNQGMQAAHLALKHGYGATRFAGRFAKQVDGDHVLILDIESYQFLERGDVPGNLTVRLALGRRDINELRRAWSGPLTAFHSDWQFATVAETSKHLFLTPREMHWADSIEFETYAPQLTTVLIDFDSWGQLSSVENQLYRTDRPKAYVYERALNDALNGDRRSSDQYERLRSFCLGEDEQNPRRLEFEAFDARLQAFRQEHPNGVER